jgi:hypothetical protein
MKAVVIGDLSPSEAVNFWSKVDRSGDCWLWTAGCFSGGYGAFSMKRKPRKAHRVAYEMFNGPIPDGLLVDHLCHTPPCVNPGHLRAVTNKQNIENSRGRSDSKSGIRGVCWDSQTGKWKAQVRHNDKLHHIGYFADLNKAGAAAAALRNELFTHNNLDR